MGVVVLGRITLADRTVAPRADMAAVGKAKLSTCSAEGHDDG